METKTNNKAITILVIVLVIIIILLGGYIIYDKLLTNNNENTINNNENTANNNVNNIVYKSYKKGEVIILSDNSKWLVLSNSDEKTDYVKVLSEKDFLEYNQDAGNDLSQELMHANTKYNDDWYNNSQTKNYLNSKVNLIPATLKEIDGYKIRLIKVSEILEFDNNWKYNEETDSYDYNGNNFNQYFRKILTMTPSNCYVDENTTKGGKCWPLYNVSSTSEGYSISHWTPGIGGLQPVVNILKSSIK